VGGAPGVRSNFNKVVFYQCLSEVPFWTSGPTQKKAGFYEKSWLATGEIVVIGEKPQFLNTGLICKVQLKQSVRHINDRINFCVYLD
jgi:hypothetical protein